MNKSDLLRAVKDKLNADDIVRNELTGYISCGKDGEPYTDAETITLYNDYYMGGLTVTKTQFYDMLSSNHIDSFNPITDYIKGVENDGLDRIAELCDTIVLDRPFTYKNEIIKKWLVGMMASCDEKSKHYNPLMLILIGPVACGKTEFFRRLLPGPLSDYLAQSDLSDGKDSKELMCKKMVILNDELDHLNKKEASHFRSFISTHEFTFRPPYGRSSVTKKRLATLCGTSNDINVITDPANNRRMIPMVIKGIEQAAYNDIDKGKLLRQAWDIYQSGEYDWMLDVKEIQYVQEISMEHEYSTKERELIEQFFYAPGEAPLKEIDMTASEVANYINARISKITVYNIPIGKNLKQMGYEYSKNSSVYYRLASRESVENIAQKDQKWSRGAETPF